MFSSSSQDNSRNVSNFDKPTIDYNNLPNPRPNNYVIIRNEVIKNHLIIELKYLDCVNYEGRKIMVYKCTLDELIKQKLIDPHFCDNENYFSPIARFEPTEQGWNNACVFANCL